MTTQRGNSDTALAGSVAAAVRVLAKMLMTWTGKGGLAKFNQTSLAVLRGHLESENGLGHSAVLQLLGEDIPGINTSSVKPQLTSLKMSKDYSRIIGEVRDEIEVENREALKALAKIEKQRREAEEAERKAEEEAKAAAARKKAAKEEADRMRAEEAHQKAEAEAALAEKRRLEAEAAMKEFEALKRTRDTADAAATKSKASDDKRDEEKIGLDPRVRKLFDVPSHVEMFRRVVTAEGIRPYLPVENQFAMAKHVLAEWEKVRARRKAAGKAEGVLTAEFIRDTITQEAIAPKQYKRKVEKEEREARERSAAIEKVKRLLADFERHCNGLWRAGYELHEYITGKKWPKGTALPLSGGFAESVKHAREILTKIERKL